MLDTENNSEKTNKPRRLFNLLPKLGIFIVTIVILFIVIPAIITRTSYDVKSVEVTAHILNILSNIAIPSLPFIYVVVTGNFFKGFLFSWFLQVLLAISFVYYGLVLIMFYRTEQIEGIHALDYYPDSPDIVITIALGWGPALIFCGIAYGIHCLIQKIRTNKTADSPFAEPPQN